MTYTNIMLENRDAIRIITVDHPPANTWDLVTVEAFEQVIDDVEKDSDARAVIVTGAGDKCFSAGFDVKDAANASLISPKARGLWTRIDRFSKPVIAGPQRLCPGGRTGTGHVLPFQDHGGCAQGEARTDRIESGNYSGVGRDPAASSNCRPFDGLGYDPVQQGADCAGGLRGRSGESGDTAGKADG